MSTSLNTRQPRLELFGEYLIMSSPNPSPAHQVIIQDETRALQRVKPPRPRRRSGWGRLVSFLVDTRCGGCD